MNTEPGIPSQVLEHQAIDAWEKSLVMQAFADGKHIEFKKKNQGEQWKMCCFTPSWNWDLYQYRVKPSPRRVWVNYSKHCIETFLKKETAIQDARERRAETVEFVEVVNDN